jgi:hypothetical protein
VAITIKVVILFRRFDIRFLFLALQVQYACLLIKAPKENELILRVGKNPVNSP